MLNLNKHTQKKSNPKPTCKFKTYSHVHTLPPTALLRLITSLFLPKTVYEPYTTSSSSQPLLLLAPLYRH